MNLEEFIRGFFRRKGLDIFIASALEKALRLLMVIFVTRILTKSDWGYLTYAQTALSFSLPVLGLGIQQGLLRFGALSDSQSDKKKLLVITLRKGLLYSSVLTILFLLAVPYISTKQPGAGMYLAVFSFQFISLFMLETVRIYSRLLNLNSLYSQIGIVYALSLSGSAVLLSHLYGGKGYAFALTVIPFVVSLYYIKKFNIPTFSLQAAKTPLFDLRKFVRYGLLISLINVISQLLFAIDILLIGNIIPDSSELIAQYKNTNIIPFSMLIFGTVFMQADLVKITFKTKTDAGYVFSYYKNYFKIFLAGGLVMLAVFYFFGEKLLLIFGTSYAGYGDLMFIFAIGVFGGLLFRIPGGNMLSAVGWVKMNTLNSVIILLLNLIFSYYAIRVWGIKGAAVVTSALMWLSGLLSLAALRYYVRLNTGKTE